MGDQNKKIEEAKEEKDFDPRKPDWQNNGIAIWEKKGKDNKTFLAIKIIGHTTMYAYKND